MREMTHFILLAVNPLSQRQKALFPFTHFCFPTLPKLINKLNLSPYLTKPRYINSLLVDEVDL